MQRQTRTVLTDGPAFVATLLCALALAAPGMASGEVAVYEVAVPLTGVTATDRAAGFAEALRAVAVRASGRREAATNRAVESADPTRYVQRYSTTSDNVLKVGFDADGVERLLQQAGLPVWPAERPVTQVVAPGADRAALEQAAQWRGLPIEWSSRPADADLDGAAGGSADARLTGAPGGGQTTWTFVHAGQRTTAVGGPQAGIDLAADTLAASYAPASTRSTAAFSLRIGGVDGLAAYAGLLSYLESLSLVRGVEVQSLDGDVVTLRVSVRGDEALLGRIVALDSRLHRSGTTTAGASPAADFVYQR
jgi:hypothetical protein